MTFSEFERVLNYCPHFTNFWLFLRGEDFCLFIFGNLNYKQFSIAEYPPSKSQ